MYLYCIHAIFESSVQKWHVCSLGSEIISKSTLDFRTHRQHNYTRDMYFGSLHLCIAIITFSIMVKHSYTITPNLGYISVKSHCGNMFKLTCLSSHISPAMTQRIGQSLFNIMMKF